MSEKTMSTPPAAAPGDDRNLVPVDPATAVSLEDQAFLIWKKQRNFILGTLVVVALALVGWFAFQGYQRSQEEEIQKAFVAAATPEAKRTFIRDHEGHALSGLALLQLADESYAAGRFDEAARDYAAATTALAEPLLSGRARIGEGMSRLKVGQVAEGERALTTLSQDETALMAYRSQALYLLAAHAAGTGDATKARDTIGRLKALDPEGYWSNMSSSLQTRLDAENPQTSLEIPTESATPAPTPAQ